MSESSRRDFLKASALGACGMGACPDALASTLGVSPASPRTPAPSAMKKGVLYSMLPENISVADRFKMARDCGFDVVQVPTTTDVKASADIKTAADSAGIHIDSVMNMDHWKYPLSSSDPAVVAKSLLGMRASLNNAKQWGADAVLLVPAVVDEQTGYREAWTRSQSQIKTLLPLAQELNVVIAIEDVWNKFLLSPLEMASYINEFDSPYVKAWFDVGNVVLYGYPQDWIHTLGKSIVKVHLKDFKHTGDAYKWVNLGEGDVDWPVVQQAFADIGYTGSVIVELKPGDQAYLRDVSQRVDRLVLGRG